MFEIKLDSKTTVCFVGLMERLERSMKEAEEEAIGEARGKAEGNLQRLVTLVCKKTKLGQSLEKIAEDLVEEVSAIEPIYNMAGKYEPEEILEKLSGREAAPAEANGRAGDGV